MNYFLELNPFMSFRKKGGVYAFFVNYDYFFLRDESARLMDLILQSIERNEQISLEVIPESFVKYLVGRNIVKEKKNGTI